jgi:tRNA (mo5U34)-methyltransferase
MKTAGSPIRTLQSGGHGSLPPELAPWFHNLHLPGGLQTAPDHPLGDFPRWKWEQIAPFLPADMSGMRALDVGCNAGFYSFELARRGADVLALDIDEHYLEQARWAAERIEVAGRVELRRMGVYELGRLCERFDLVLLLGVLYHLRHPLLALDLVAEATAGTLVLQTLTMPGGERGRTPPDTALHERELMRAPSWPKMAFIEHELAGDATNWWAPDRGCVEAMLRSAGMEVVEEPGDEIWICRPAAAQPPRHVLDELAAVARGSPVSGH